MRNSGNKLIALMLGILLSLVVLEVSLRVVGVFYSHWGREGKVAKKEPGTIVILCLGDSFTQGFGAPAGRGYPGQLAALLQEKYPGKQVKAVINKGRGAYNTAMILERFDKEVDEVDPDILVILAGGANRWNAYGYVDYLNRNGFLSRLNNWLYEIKIFKLAKLFLFDLHNKKAPLLDSYVFPPEEKIPPDAEAWRGKGRACEREGKYDEAILWYEKIVKKYPLALSGYDGLKRVYLETGKKEDERRMLRKLIEMDPQNLRYILAYVPRYLYDSNDKEDLQFMQRFAHANPVVRDILKKATEREKYHREMKAWVKHDIEEMIRRAQGRGIKVILQTYPYYDNGDNYENLCFINEALREVAKDNPVLFIDQERIIDRMALKGADKDDYFEPAKVHCSEKGYGVMAENIYCGLLAREGLGILPAVDPEEKRKCSER